MYRSKNEDHVIQFHHFMANTWKKTMKTETGFIFLGSKITVVTAAVGGKDANPWKKSYEKPDCILKSRGISLPAKIFTVKAMVLPEVVTECQSWTIKKAEYQRIDIFKRDIVQDS